jgi:hypothetical protein
VRAAEQARPALLPEPVAVAADVRDVAVVQQPVKDGGSDDGVTQDIAPVAALTTCPINGSIVVVSGKRRCPV